MFLQVLQDQIDTIINETRGIMTLQDPSVKVGSHVPGRQAETRKMLQDRLATLIIENGIHRKNFNSIASILKNC